MIENTLKSTDNDHDFNFIGGDNSFLMNGEQAKSIRESRLMSIEYDADKEVFYLGEQCDECFSATLSEDDFDKWIEEILEFKSLVRMRLSCIKRDM